MYISVLMHQCFKGYEINAIINSGSTFYFNRYISKQILTCLTCCEAATICGNWAIRPSSALGTRQRTGARICPCSTGYQLTGSRAAITFRTNGTLCSPTQMCILATDACCYISTYCGRNISIKCKCYTSL